MSDENDLNPADRELEEALRSLAPANARIDPIAAAFVAGAKSTQHKARAWQSVAAIMAVALIGSWMIPLPVRTRPGIIQVTSMPIAEKPVNPQSVLAIERTIGTGGIDALPRALVPASRALEEKDIF
jgi:hypothetical protein